MIYIIILLKYFNVHSNEFQNGKNSLEFQIKYFSNLAKHSCSTLRWMCLARVSVLCMCLFIIIRSVQLPVLVPPCDCVCAWMLTPLNLPSITAPGSYESCWLWGVISLCGSLTWQVCHCFWMLASCGQRRCSRWVRSSLSSPNTVEENRDSCPVICARAVWHQLTLPREWGTALTHNSNITLVSRRGSFKPDYIPTWLCHMYLAQRAA